MTVCPADSPAFTPIFAPVMLASQLIHEIPRSTNQVVTGATLCSTERKVVGHVPPRNYEQVVLGDRICIPNNDRQRVLQDNLTT